MTPESAPQPDVGRHYLAGLFEPRTAAVVGATESPGKIGDVLMANMLAAGFKGSLYGVNPKHRSVRGLPCFASLQALPAPADLAVVATPAATIPGVLADCGRAGIHAAVVITAGFGETGAAGRRLEERVRAAARAAGVRMLGPNCLGLARPRIGLNATFARGHAAPGSIGLVSQSGAVCTAMMDWAALNQVGFSSIVSLGGSVDIDFGEIIDYLACDPHTQHILMYIEGVRDARRFVSSLRAAARIKPVILMKVGRHPAGTRAAVSHTGAIVGADDVFDAAVRRTGAVRVTSIGQLVAAAQALSENVRPRGDRLAVITNGGGPGVMAADRAADLGLPLATLSDATLEGLRTALPSNWSHGNPVDLIGDAGAGRYRAAVAACLADPGVDGALVILTPQAMTDAVAAAQAVIDAGEGQSKPLIACWMGEQSVLEGRQRLRAAGIPVFRTPDPAVEMFAHLAAYHRNQQAMLQVPGPLAHASAPDVPAAQRIIGAALARGETTLGSEQSKAVLAAFRVPVAQGVPAASADEAVQAAQRIGFPVVLKIASPDISHKSDVGGVRLKLADAREVQGAFAAMLDKARLLRPDAQIDGVTVEPMVVRPQGRELMVGVLRDPVFGPAITFGAGGTAVEVWRDRSVALPPLSEALARDMIAHTHVARLLADFRGTPAADHAAIVSVLLRVSELACALPQVRELDLNPLVADGEGVMALDARIVVAPPGAAPADGAAGGGRFRHLAIHPYPEHLACTVELADGHCIGLRPIRPEDAQMEQAFVSALSPATRRFRFMNTMRELTRDMLVRFTQIDYDRELALVALDPPEGGGRPVVEIGVARYVSYPDGESCEFAIVIADAWQGRGLGRVMMTRLFAAARDRGLRRMIGHVLTENDGMLAMCRRLGAEITPMPGERDIRLVCFSL